MINQFVDHFKVKDYGFNFFPALSFIIGTFLAQIIMFVYFFQSNLIRKVDFPYLPDPFVLFYAIFFSSFLILCLHLAKTDVSFLVIFSLGNIVVGVLTRLIPWVTFIYPPSYYQKVSFARTVLGIDSILGSMVFGLATALALLIFYNIFKRLDFTLVFGLLAGEFVGQLYYLIFDWATGGKLSPWRLEFYVLSLIEAALCGFLFYLGYVLYMRAKGWRVAKGEVLKTGEETGPRVNFLSKKVTFGVLLATALFNVVLLAVIITKLNLNREDYFQSGAFQTASAVWADIVFLPVLVLGTFLSLLSAVVFFLFIYKSWTALQDGRTKISPLSAALLLLVPIFNLYWIIRVYYGFALEHNSLADRHRLNVPKLPSWLYLTSGVLTVLNAIALVVFSLLLNSRDRGDYYSGLRLLIFSSVFQIAVVLAVVYLTCQAVNRIPAEIYQRPQATRPGG
jgi:hypothetical protein